MLDNPPFDIEAVLSPVRRGLVLQRSGTWASRGVASGAVAGALLLLAGRLVWGHPVIPLAVSALIAGLAAAAILTVLQWPSAHEAARVTDQHFALHDRMTTALEYRHSREPLMLLQRRDLARIVGRLPLGQSAPPVVNRRDGALLAVALTVFVGALALPQARPVHRIATRSNQQGITAVRQVALAHLAAVSRDFQSSLTSEQRRSAAVRQALAALSNLQTQLRQVHSKEQALREISDAQARLQRVSSLLLPVSANAARVLTKTMHGYMTHQQQKAGAVKGGTKLNKTASDLLKHMAATLGSQSAGQQQQTARALMNAANNIKDDQVRSDLRQAASALGHGDAKTAQQALNNAASRFSSSQDTQHTKSSLANARRKLDAVKSDVSGLKRRSPASRGTNGQNSAASARNRLQGGQEAPSTRAAPPVAGNAKQVHGKGNKARSRNTDSTQNVGAGSDRAGSGSAGRYAEVFVPGLVTKGQQLLPIQLQASRRRLPLVPYQQVIARYNKSARSALSRSELPPSLQDYVRKYFTVLSQ